MFTTYIAHREILEQAGYLFRPGKVPFHMYQNLAFFIVYPESNEFTYCGEMFTVTHPFIGLESELVSALMVAHNPSVFDALSREYLWEFQTAGVQEYVNSKKYQAEKEEPSLMSQYWYAYLCLAIVVVLITVFNAYLV